MTRFLLNIFESLAIRGRSIRVDIIFDVYCPRCIKYSQRVHIAGTNVVQFILAQKIRNFQQELNRFGAVQKINYDSSNFSWNIRYVIIRKTVLCSITTNVCILKVGKVMESVDFLVSTRELMS